MFDSDKWKEIWITITRNKVRSILTAFGVFWGIFMLVVLIGAGNSLKDGFSKQFSGFASNTCFFQSRRTGEAYKGFRKGRYWRIKNSDLKLISERAQTVDLVSPMLFLWGSSKDVAYKQKTGDYGMRGVSAQHFRIETQHVLAGRLFNEIDDKNRRKVCVIGRLVAENLFGKANPIGEYIKVKGIYFQVIGVIRPQSSVNMGGDVQETVFIPYSTLQQAFNMGDEVHFLGVTAKKGRTASEVEEEVSSILKNANNISLSDKQAVLSFNIEKQFQMINNLLLGVDLLIWLIGIGTLLTGIVGVTNIMLVTVRERTREIGVRRALGARPISILSQIVSESLILTTIAGLGGFLLGILVLQGVTYVLFSVPSENMFFMPPIVSFSAAIASMMILICAGVIAGIVPSVRALQIKAIDAIRDE